MLKFAPIYVYLLRVGSRYYYEQGVRGGVSTLRAYLTEVECLDYRNEGDAAELTALTVDAVELGELWDELEKIHDHSVDQYQSSLRLEVDGEVLWDADARLH